MRIPQPRQPTAAQPLRTSARATQPSRTYVAGGTTGPQGTPGGKANRKPGVAGRPMKLGHEVYLWVLVVIEIALLGGFRKYFRRFHGG